MNNKQDIFVGVDGGASNCRLRLEDASGRLLGCGRAGLASIKWSVAETWNSIMAAFAAAAQEAQIDINDSNYRFHLGCGLAGCEIPQACKEFLDKTPTIFATKCLQSDAYTACLGAHDGQDGAIIIVGTGVVSVQIENGNIITVGGWGFPHGDEGSAAWLGLEATRLTTQWLDGRYTVASPLLSAILYHSQTSFQGLAQIDPRNLVLCKAARREQPEHIETYVRIANDEANAAENQISTGIHNVTNDAVQLVTWANKANAGAFATLAPQVIQHADNGDSNAIMLLQRAAQEIDKIGMVLAKKTQGGKTLPCCLLGGLAPFIEKWLGKDLLSRLVPCKYDATVGAILMVKNRIIL